MRKMKGWSQNSLFLKDAIINFGNLQNIVLFAPLDVSKVLNMKMYLAKLGPVNASYFRSFSFVLAV